MLAIKSFIENAAELTGKLVTTTVVVTGVVSILAGGLEYLLPAPTQWLMLHMQGSNLPFWQFAALPGFALGILIGLVWFAAID